MNRVVIVAGPTASGKTTLGIELAKQLGGAIISADSRMVYRGLDIGTGKPTWEHRSLDTTPWINPRSSPFGPVYSIDGIDHYGLDLVEPETHFTLTDWLTFARSLIAELQSQSIQPVIVGGTGLYLKALVHGFVPPPTDPIRRVAVEQRSDDELLDALYEFDPVTAQKLMGNRRRLVRAVEVLELTGRPISDPRNAPPLAAIVVAPTVGRTVLYRRIDARLHERFETGLIDEVRGLINQVVEDPERAKRVDWLHGLGLEYRFITDWLSNFPPGHFHLPSGMSEVENLEIRIGGAIHRYARRQLTYLRHQLPVQWVRDLDDALELVSLGV